MDPVIIFPPVLLKSTVFEDILGRSPLDPQTRSSFLTTRPPGAISKGKNCLANYYFSGNMLVFGRVNPVTKPIPIFCGAKHSTEATDLH